MLLKILRISLFLTALMYFYRSIVSSRVTCILPFEYVYSFLYYSTLKMAQFNSNYVTARRLYFVQQTAAFSLMSNGEQSDFALSVSV